jgi:Spy/CpxP family protein refolding chaperone
MKRVLVVAMVAAMMASPAMAISHFKKIWGGHYTPTGDDPGADEVDKDFLRATRKAGCYLCHVKGEKKDEARNEYGEALHKYLDAENYDRDRIKAEPEKVKEEIIAAFKKVEEMKSKDGKKFGEKIKNNELPATDANLD